MVTITSWITVSKNKFPVLTFERGGIPDGLVEQRDKTSVKAGWANASHHKVRVSHVIFVIGGVDIFAVPAGGKHQFEANTISTMFIEICLIGKEVTIER